MSNARKAALQLLNRDWSRGVWKQWLGNVLKPPVEPPAPPHAAAAAVAVPLPVAAPEQPVNSGHATALTGRLGSCSAAASQAARSAREQRRSQLRARFDAVDERLMAVEDGIDTLLRRSAQRDKLDRRTDRQSVEMIDSVAVAGERQAMALEGLLSSVARLEQAVSRLDHGLSRVERKSSEHRRESHVPPGPTQPRSSFPSAYPESHYAPREAPRDRASTSLRAAAFEDGDADESSGIHGSLSEMSLATVLAMLEIERHTGRLKVAKEDGALASFELSEGNVVSSRLSEADADPLHTLRAALRWKQGRFWFRQQAPETPSFAPRSIGSLLLEATRQNDESFADVG